MRPIPLIAISTQFESDPDRCSLRREYIDALAHLGADACILPSTADGNALARMLSRFDGLLIPGGDDIDPSAYGEAPLGIVDGMTNPDRDRAERDLIVAAERMDMPFLGICRGMQMANVTFGGTLIQDISTCMPGCLDHWQHAHPSLASHSIEIAADSLLESATGRTKMRVNSLHHQCVNELGHGCLACAFSEDGLVEALCRPSSKFFLGVQWHPESTRAEDPSRAIFHAFTQACADYAQQRER